MRQFTSCVWVALLSDVLSLPTEPDHLSKWETFKALHGKNHPSHEELIREKLHLERTAHIDAHNELHEKGVEGFPMRRSQYSDLPPEEFVGVGQELLPRRNLSYLLFPPKPFPDILSENFDWRDSNIMTPVRNQGKCGACYAFASIAVFEAHLKWRTGQTYDLSEQNILDCTYKRYGSFNKGCDEGMVDDVFHHIINTGVVREDQHPYYSINGKFRGHCPPLTPIADIAKLKLTPQFFETKTERQLAWVVFKYGPVVVSVAGGLEGDFRLRDFRGDGIFDEPDLINKTPNHFVVLVGFGTQNGTDYWIIKNSFGEKWGIGGYGKIRRGVNMCNILHDGATNIKVEK